jgi:starch-binding outer membrane protein, SusD/RagB family
MKNISIKIVFLGILLSCDRNLDKINPNSLTPESFYKNSKELVNASNAVYAVLQSEQLISREYFYVHDLRSGDLASGGGQLEAPRAQLLQGTNDAANAVANRLWSGLFQMIHRANALIEKAPNASLPTQADKDLAARAVAESKFLRAFGYFELVTLWGGVPLYTNYVKPGDAAKPRSSVAQVYEQIEKDLLEAIAVLPATYDPSQQGRATKGAARVLAARAYMQNNDYAKAKAQLDEVVNSGLYALTPNYISNFNIAGEFNIESIFEVAFEFSNYNYGWAVVSGDGIGSNGESTIRNMEYGAAWRNAIPSNSLLDEFETTLGGEAFDDPRLGYNVYFHGDTYKGGTDTLDLKAVNTSLIHGKTVQIVWKKYNDDDHLTDGYYPGGINQRLFRYAEVLLMLAECENELSNPAKAIGYLNQIRARPSVNVPLYPTVKFPVSSKPEIFAAIQHEKRVEMAVEQIRFRDILRWRAQGKLTTEPFSYFQPNKHELLPLPQSEISANPQIGPSSQNPGY